MHINLISNIFHCGLRMAALTLALAMLPAVAQARCDLPPDAAQISRATLEAVNATRQANGMRALTAHPALERAARDQSCHMASSRTLTHSGPNGAQIGSRVRAAGYNYRSVAENVAHGYTGPNAVVAGWMASPGHRQNILRNDVTHGAIVPARDAGGRLYWTMIVARPR